MHFALGLDGLATGTVAGTFTALIGIKMADTLGHRGRVRSINIGGDGNAPQDLQVTVRLQVSDNTGDGTSTDASGSVAKKDPYSVATRAAAVGKQYSAPPTTLGRIVWEGAFNTRGVLIKEWYDPDAAPEWGQKETMFVLATIGSGSTAAGLAIDLEWEEH